MKNTFYQAHVYLTSTSWRPGSFFFSTSTDRNVALVLFKLSFFKLIRPEIVLINILIEKKKIVLLISDTIPLSVTLVSHKFKTCKFVR